MGLLAIRSAGETQEAIENTNDIIRFLFPKGFDFRVITDEDVQFVEELINNRPRKCLGWKTPNEIFAESVALA